MNQPDQPVISPQAGIPDQKSRTHWPSVLQFVFSTLAIIGLWSIAFITLALGLMDRTPGLGSANNSLSLLMISGITFASGLLVTPSAVLSIRRITGRPVTSYPRYPSWIQPRFLIFVLPVVLLSGYLVITQTALSWLLLPPLHVLAVLIPIVWLVYLMVRGLPLGSPQRSWGVFDSGLILGPALILLAELLALASFVIIALVYISSHPDLYNEIMSLFEQLTGVPSTEIVIELLAPYLTSPWTIFAIFVFAAIVVPLIEEALKPIGVWLLAGRNLSPAEGFAAGALCGAGFALFESMAMTSGGVDWVVPVVARISTAVIHIFTTSLMGWALASAWSERRYARLGITYLGVVLLHGTWNGLTLMMTVSGLFLELGQGTQAPFLALIGTLAPFLLSLITILVFIAMLRLNRGFRTASQGETQSKKLTQNSPGVS